MREGVRETLLWNRVLSRGAKAVEEISMMKNVTIQRIISLANAKRTEAVAEEVLQLQTSDKFRLAAEILDMGNPDVALAIATRACQEI